MVFIVVPRFYLENFHIMIIPANCSHIVTTTSCIMVPVRLRGKKPFNTEFDHFLFFILFRNKRSFASEH
jgi:hypothetical protein